MNRNTIIIPKEISEIVAERSRIWDEHDKLQGQVARLDELSKKVGAFGPADEIGSLTEDNLPPTEVLRSVTEMKKELEHIENAGRQVHECETEIQNIKSRVILIVIVAIVIFVILPLFFCPGILAIFS